MSFRAAAFAALLALPAVPVTAWAAGPPVAVPDAPALSREGEALVRAVREAISAAQARQAALPPAADDGERLVRMAELDQAAREALYGLDLSQLDLAERQAALDAAWARVEAVDRRNQTALRKMLPPNGGWFTRADYGDEAARAAWLIVIHAVDDRRLMREALTRMEPLLAAGGAEAQGYAALYDRLAVLEKRPQRYGTQPVCKRGVWTAGEVEDPAGLAARRAALGLEAVDVGGFRPPPGCG